MFKKTVRVAVAALAMTALLPSCGGGLPNYDYQIDMKPYENAITARGKTYLTLVNKENPCGTDYTPENLSSIPAELTLYGKGCRWNPPPP